VKEALNTAPQFIGGNAAGNIRIAHQRRLALAFVDVVGEGEGQAILDLHMVPEKMSGSSVYSLHALLASGEEDARFEKVAHDGKKFGTVHALMHKDLEKELRLPYGDGEFDWVFCNFVIEHAGKTGQQQALLAELWRIARKGIFVTASNKRHPIEFNTGLPLLHWLPRNAWKTSLNMLGKDMAETDRLPHLLDSASLGQMAASLAGPKSYDIGHVRMAGIKAQFFLMVQKTASQINADIPE
jgi:hypothetical protein